MAGKAGAVIAMDVNSGRILAFASAPPVHLEDFVGGISTENWQGLLDDIKRRITSYNVCYTKLLRIMQNWRLILAVLMVFFISVVNCSSVFADAREDIMDAARNNFV